MKVVFLQNVTNVGRQGEVKVVKDGFATNYLIPHKLAKVVGEDFVATVVTAQQPKVVISAIGSLASTTITVSGAVTSAKNLYAGISAKEVMEQVKLQTGVALNEKQLVDFKPLKHLGHFQIKIQNNKETVMLNILVKAKVNAPEH